MSGAAGVDGLVQSLLHVAEQMASGAGDTSKLMQRGDRLCDQLGAVISAASTNAVRERVAHTLLPPITQLLLRAEQLLPADEAAPAAAWERPTSIIHAAVTAWFGMEKAWFEPTRPDNALIGAVTLSASESSLLLGSQLLPVLARMLPRVAAAFVSADGSTLTATARADQGVCTSACSNLGTIFSRVMKLAPEPTLAVPGLMVAYVRMLAAMQLTSEHRAAIQSQWERDVCTRDLCSKCAVLVSVISLQRQRGAPGVMHALEQLSQSPAYVRVLLGTMLSSVAPIAQPSSSSRSKPRRAGRVSSSSASSSSRPGGADGGFAGRTSSSSTTTSSSSSSSVRQPADPASYWLQLYLRLDMPEQTAAAWQLPDPEFDAPFVACEVIAVVPALMAARAADGGGRGSTAVSEWRTLQPLLELVPPLLLSAAAAALEQGHGPDNYMHSVLGPVPLSLQLLGRVQPDAAQQVLQLALPLLQRVVASCGASRGVEVLACIEGTPGFQAATCAIVLLESIALVSCCDGVMIAGDDVIRLCMSVEAVLRCCRLGRDGWQNVLVAVQGLAVFPMFPGAGMLAGGFSEPPASSSMPALSRAVLAAPPNAAEHAHLFALLTSFVKVQLELSLEPVPGRGICCTGMVYFLSIADSCSGDSDGGGSGAAAERVPWLTLPARVIHFAGTRLSALLGRLTPVGLGRQVQQCLTLVEDLEVLLDWLSSGGDATVENPAGGGPGGTPGVVDMAWVSADGCLRQLQQELLPAVHRGERLLLHAQAALRARSSSSSSSSSAAVGGDADMAAMTAAGSDQAAMLAALQRSFVAAALPAQLKAFAARICAELPQRFCCNHPGCGSLSKASELALVGGKGTRCAGCRTARYCGPKCQAAHWPHHKPVCRRLNQAAAAAAGQPTRAD